MAELVVPRSIPTAFSPLISRHILSSEYSTLSWIAGVLKPDTGEEVPGLAVKRAAGFIPAVGWTPAKPPG